MTNRFDESDSCLIIQTYPGKYADYDPFKKLRREIESCGITTETTQFRSMPQAGLEFLGWTALFCYLLQPFFKTFLSEAAKDAYPHIKKLFKGLWGNIFGSPEAPQITTIGPKGPVTSEFSMKYSLCASFKWGRVKLLFREGCEEEEFQRATELFLDMMMEYHSGRAFQGISLDEEENCYQRVVCIHYDRSADMLRVFNPLAHLGSDAIENLRRLEMDKRGQDNS